MNIILTFAIICAVLMTAVAAVSRLDCLRTRRESEEIKARLADYEKENMQLREKVSYLKKTGGINETTVLALIGEIARIENNLYHMQDVPGRKQVSKAVDRMKVTLQAEDYTIVPLLGTTYWEGMQVNASFISDENLPSGSSIITSVQKPQVNRAGKMIQAASVTVAQNE